MRGPPPHHPIWPSYWDLAAAARSCAMSGWWNGMMPAVHSRSAAATFCRTSLDSISARVAASAQVTCRSTTSTEIAPAALNSAATTEAKSGRGIAIAFRNSSRHGFTSSNRTANNRASSAVGIVSSASSAGAGCMVSKSSVCTRSAAYSGLSITDVTHVLNCAQASKVAAGRWRFGAVGKDKSDQHDAAAPEAMFLVHSHLHFKSTLLPWSDGKRARGRQARCK